MQIEMNNREVIIQGEGILNLIPQRPPIVMVDSFFGIEKNHSYSGLTVTADNIFCETGEQQEGEQPETGKLQEAGTGRYGHSISTVLPCFPAGNSIQTIKEMSLTGTWVHTHSE